MNRVLPSLRIVGWMPTLAKSQIASDPIDATAIRSRVSPEKVWPKRAKYRKTHGCATIPRIAAEKNEPVPIPHVNP
jgi:hypothetical protein